jgi:PKHD-type hydroxylase
MKGEWCYFRSYFDKETCEKIIEDCKTIPAQDAVVGLNSNFQLDEQGRRSKVRFINNGDWRFSYLFDALWKTATQANHDFFNIHITKLDFIQIAEYSDEYQGEYKEHHDVFWLNNDPFYHRKLSCVIQLSDPASYEGGDFELTNTSTFPLANEMRDQGTFIYFPSFFNHKANPVIRGTRYSVAAWFDGPKWR